jgi:hypothetical protein
MAWKFSHMPFRDTKNWAMKQIEDCKNVPEVNSRMMFLVTSTAIIACMFILTIGLFYSDRVKEVYEGGMAVLLGGHGVAAYGRSKTKGETSVDDSDPAPAPAPAVPVATTGSDQAKG